MPNRNSPSTVSLLRLPHLTSSAHHPAAVEEFSVWKKNTPLLYDLVICHSLEWPSLTVQWLPSPPSSFVGDLAIHKLILGTHTSDDSPNFLMVADAYLPRDPSSAIAIDPDNSIFPKGG
ncbi:hypothetical protein CASFOL_037332 [Castilleja foliolosa]|uniref:Histone-binding protein RBBP4-like N-terminal domain-containing protein n=1 Tax=Castilleja foliolosa TaxID=1961234 RepID=A0ABD3BNF7_9LAMI